MKEFQTEDIRNLAVVGHGSCGKTMLCESMLACGGELNRLGNIESGSTVSDFDSEEKKRQISISASLMHTEWNKKKLNILDAPGYADFVGEALSCLRVADMALITIHAGQSVEVGTNQMWAAAGKCGAARMIVLNGMDKEHVDYKKLYNHIKTIFGNSVFPLTVPVNQGPGFNQVVDIMNKKLVTYKDDVSGAYEESDLSPELQNMANEIYEKLVEAVAESDDTLLEKFFDEGSLGRDEFLHGVTKAIKSGSLTPLFVTSATTNVGVAQMMNFISEYGISPMESQAAIGSDSNDEEVSVEISNPETSLFVFKSLSDAHVGELSFFKVYSGKVESGAHLINRNNDASERMGQFFLLNGKKRDSVSCLYPGDIAAAVKLKNTSVGNTLTSSKLDVKYKKVEYPKPNINSAIKTKNQGDEEKMAIGLSTIHDEDPTFSYRVDSELGQTIISGLGELHLEVVVSRLSQRFNVELETFQPKIPYRETIKGIGDAKYRHKKQSGGAGQFAEVHLKVQPAEQVADVEFINSLVGQNVDRTFVPSVEKGVQKACLRGTLAGYKVIGVKANFYDGKQHPVDSKDIAFQIAGEHAFREAFMHAHPCLLEPIVNVMIKVPEEYMGDVMGDISSRRGKIQGMDAEGGFQVIKALVPQAEMYHYSTILRSLTGGRGIHSESFDHYDPVPGEIEKKIIAASKVTSTSKEKAA